MFNNDSTPFNESKEKAWLEKCTEEFEDQWRKEVFLPFMKKACEHDTGLQYDADWKHDLIVSNVNMTLDMLEKEEWRLSSGLRWVQLLSNPNIVFDVIMANKELYVRLFDPLTSVDIDCHQHLHCYRLMCNSGITWEMIQRNKEVIGAWDFFFLANVNCTMEIAGKILKMMEDGEEKYKCITDAQAYFQLSLNPNLNADMIKAHPAARWSWQNIACFSDLTFQELLEVLPQDISKEELDLSELPRLTLENIKSEQAEAFEWYISHRSFITPVLLTNELKNSNNSTIINCLIEELRSRNKFLFTQNANFSFETCMEWNVEIDKQAHPNNGRSFSANFLQEVFLDYCSNASFDFSLLDKYPSLSPCYLFLSRNTFEKEKKDYVISKLARLSILSMMDEDYFREEGELNRRYAKDVVFQSEYMIGHVAKYC